MAEPWNNEMNHLLCKIERETEHSMCKLQKSLKRCGLKFDGKFRKYFLNATNNRLSETFDRFEMDYIDRTRMNILRKRQNSSDYRMRSQIHMNRSRTSRCSRSRSHNNDHIREIFQHSRSHETKRVLSVKDRLGAKMNQHSSLQTNWSQLEQIDEEQHKRNNNESIEDKWIEELQSDESFEIDDSVNIEDLESILQAVVNTKLPNNESILFYCIYCHHDGNCSISSSIEDVYAHWLSAHKDIHDAKPFAFSIEAPNAACFYCDKIGTLQQQLKHQKDMHRNRSIAIVSPLNRKECMICGYSGSNWLDHFETNHQMFLQIDAFSPMTLTDTTLTDLLTIDIHKRRQCGICEEIFETEHQLEFHSLDQHVNEEIISNISNVPQKIYLICDICNQHIDLDIYLNHLEEHSFQFRCSKCDFSTDDLVNVAFHENQKHHINDLNSHYLQFAECLQSHFFRTKVAFKNGLILTKHNLMGTYLDDYSEFRYMVETIIDVKIKKYKWLLRKHVSEEIDNISNDDDDCRSISSEEFILSTIASSTVLNHFPPSKPWETTTNCNKKFFRELRDQQRIIRNICIHGIPRRENENLHEIVLRTFEQLGAHISLGDISLLHRISKSDPLIIVKFSNSAAKRRLMICRRLKTLETSDIMDLLPGVFPSKIHIFNHLTTFFDELRKIAKQALIKHRLFSYCLTKHGFLVKRTKNSTEKLIFSINELHAYIQ